MFAVLGQLAMVGALITVVIKELDQFPNLPDYELYFCQNVGRNHSPLPCFMKKCLNKIAVQFVGLNLID